jgi:hypothetical protein
MDGYLGAKVQAFSVQLNNLFKTWGDIRLSFAIEPISDIYQPTYFLRMTVVQLHNAVFKCIDAYHANDRRRAAEAAAKAEEMTTPDQDPEMDDGTRVRSLIGTGSSDEGPARSAPSLSPAVEQYLPTEELAKAVAGEGDDAATASPDEVPRGALTAAEAEKLTGINRGTIHREKGKRIAVDPDGNIVLDSLLRYKADQDAKRAASEADLAIPDDMAKAKAQARSASKGR